MLKKILTLCCLFMATGSLAATREVNLTVAYKTVSFAGKQRQALAVNNQIPAPVLHFREGDHVRINVTNLLNEETAIHWHGMILPWQMDGVLGVTQRGIQPGKTFHYEYTIRQSGTYWYHAHAGLQEQQGLYGAFIVDPIVAPSYHYNKDFTIVLSDWSNTNPNQILSNLKKDGDYYSPRMPLQASLQKFIHDYRKASAAERANLWDDYKMMQQTRMGLYDLSDVAYDAFLLNGQTSKMPWYSMVKQGDVVRLRFIGASGSTVFRVKMPDTDMQMVHVEGNDIKPYTLREFTIASGETFDVLVRITQNRPYYIYAESIDTLGSVYGALLTSTQQLPLHATIQPFPEPQPVSRQMMAKMMGKMHVKSEMPVMKHEQMKHDMMNHESMDHESMDHESMDHEHMNHQMFHKPIKHAVMQHDSKHDMSNMQHDSKHDMSNMQHDNKHDMSNMQHDNKHDMSSMQHMNMTMPTEPSIFGDHKTTAEQTYQTSIDTKYEKMRAAVKTNDPDKPIAAVIKMELFGYMNQYIWFINGVPEYNAKPIVLDPAKRYRIVFTNTSMMRHPMHIHGHWFILRKGNGAYDPLLHTIEVAPGETITADVDTDASGQWLFHCHFLYHMMTGMSRVFQYSTLIELTQNDIKPEDEVRATGYINRPIVRVDEVRPLDKMLVHHPMPHAMRWWYSTLLEVSANPFNNNQFITYHGLYGADYNKLQLSADDIQIERGQISDADIDVFYWHLLNQFWAVKGGVNYFYRPAFSPYWQPGIGIEGVLPYFIETNLTLYQPQGVSKLDLEISRDTQLTNNLFLRLGISGIAANKTVNAVGVGRGLNQVVYTIRPYYRIAPGMNLFLEYESEHNYGDYARFLQLVGQDVVENNVMAGLSVLL